MTSVTGSSALRRPLALVAALALLGAAACTEDLTTSTTCPGLCPEQELNVEQVELQPVVEDTTLAGFPLLGTEQRLLVARVGDSVETRAVYRFDSLPRFYRGPNGDSLGITQAIDPVLEVFVFRRNESVVPQAVTLEAFDVDVAGNDTSAATLGAAFTAARRLGGATVPARAASDTTGVDTLRIPLPPATLLRKINTDSSLRVGLRLPPGAEARLILAPALARVVFRATPDTTIARLTALPTSKTPVGQPQLQSDQSAFTVIVRGTPPPTGSVLAVGGLPGRRSLLRFAVPAAILDSSAILRATLVLTQRPVRGYRAADTLRLQPLAVTTSATVLDVRRRVLLASNALSPFTGRRVLGTEPLPIVPGDSGRVEIPIAELVGAWRSANNFGFVPELVLAAALEGATPLQAHFFSIEAAPGLRPLLRLSYVRRINFNVP